MNIARLATLCFLCFGLTLHAEGAQTNTRPIQTQEPSTHIEINEKELVLVNYKRTDNLTGIVSDEQWFVGSEHTLVFDNNFIVARVYQNPNDKETVFSPVGEEWSARRIFSTPVRDIPVGGKSDGVTLFVLKENGVVLKNLPTTVYHLPGISFMDVISYVLTNPEEELEDRVTEYYDDKSPSPKRIDRVQTEGGKVILDTTTLRDEDVDKPTPSATSN